MILKNGSNNTEKAPNIEDGSYPGYVIRIIDIGMQEKTDYKTGESVGQRPTVEVTFELPTELMEYHGEQKPRWLSKEYIYSISQKGNVYINEKSGLAELIKSCGKATGEFEHDSFYDIRKLLGETCLVNVGTTSGGNDKVTSTTKLPKGFPQLPEPSKEPKCFDLDEPDMEMYDSLPQWMRDKIGLDVVEDTIDPDDDIPF